MHLGDDLCGRAGDDRRNLAQRRTMARHQRGEVAKQRGGAWSNLCDSRVVGHHLGGVEAEQDLVDVGRIPGAEVAVEVPPFEFEDLLRHVAVTTAVTRLDRGDDRGARLLECLTIVRAELHSHRFDCRRREIGEPRRVGGSSHGRLCRRWTDIGSHSSGSSPIIAQ